MKEKKKQIFSIPINPYMTKETTDNVFIPFIKKYKEYIFDLYFTARIPPFTQDAMGAVFTPEQNLQLFQNAMYIQEKTGVKVSATFNNTKVVPTYENLELFMKNLRPLYNAGLRSMTQPHNHWMLSGLLKREFPEMYIKNTVLKEIKTAQMYWDACKAGYDYVNVDRVLLRNEDELKRIKKAQSKFKEQTGKYVPIAILANEGCRGNCPTMTEHYNINNSSGSNLPGTDKPYFYQKISSFTCPKWRMDDPAYVLKIGNLPPYREDIERILEYVDVIKMHGREGLALQSDTVNFIETYCRENYDGELHDISVRNFIEDLGVDPEKLKQWRKHIRNCKFECWDCSYCDELYKSAKKKNELDLNFSMDDLVNKL